MDLPLQVFHLLAARIAPAVECVQCSLLLPKVGLDLIDLHLELSLSLHEVGKLLLDRAIAIVALEGGLFLGKRLALAV